MSIKVLESLLTNQFYNCRHTKDTDECEIPFDEINLSLDWPQNLNYQDKARAKKMQVQAFYYALAMPYMDQFIHLHEDI